MAAQVVGQAEPWVSNLEPQGPSKELVVDLVEHPQARGPDRVSKALQATVRVDRKPPVNLEESRIDVLLGPAPRAEPQVFVDDELGDREAIVNDGQAYFLARVFDARLVVACLAARTVSSKWTIS